MKKIKIVLVVCSLLIAAQVAFGYYGYSYDGGYGYGCGSCGSCDSCGYEWWY